MELTTREWSKEQTKLLKDTICKGASDDELKLFAYICQRTGLDPFARQIYMIARWDSNLGKNVMTPQTSIDGFRLTAERSDKYQGQLGPWWCGQDGLWVDVWLKDFPPAAAKVGVLKQGFKEATYAVATWNEYKQTKKDGSVTNLWKKLPSMMLAKCAESLALRKVFPAELSGIYTTEEMAQAAGEQEEKAPTREEKAAVKDSRPNPAPKKEQPQPEPETKDATPGLTKVIADYFKKILEGLEGTGRDHKRGELCKSLGIDDMKNVPGAPENRKRDWINQLGVVWAKEDEERKKVTAALMQEEMDKHEESALAEYEREQAELLNK